MKTYIIMFFIFVALLISANLSFSSVQLAPKKMIWPFDGIFGKVDIQAAQRGFQVYKEVCSTCHAMEHLAYRNLQDLEFTVEEVKAVALEYQFSDGPNDQGEMFERPGIPADKFYNPYNNEKAARAANNGAYPPDLSLIIKSRDNAANYVYSILTGYVKSPSDFKVEEGLHYNPYFHDSKIAMPQPLFDGQVSYIDGTNSNIEQMARDVVIFLQWASEPEMEHRKSMGLKVVIFLIIWTVILYVVKEKIWSDIKN